jgi:hypothetical protein
MRKRKGTGTPKAIIFENRDKELGILSRIFNFVGVNLNNDHVFVQPFSTPRVARDFVRQNTRELKQRKAKVVYKGKRLGG